MYIFIKAFLWLGFYGRIRVRDTGGFFCSEGDIQMKKETKEKYLYPMAIRATVVVAGVLVFFLIYRIDQVERELGRLIGILMPFIYGCVMAYLVRPVCSFLSWNSRTRSGCT